MIMLDGSDECSARNFCESVRGDQNDCQILRNDKSLRNESFLSFEDLCGGEIMATYILFLTLNIIIIRAMLTSVIHTTYRLNYSDHIQAVVLDSHQQNPQGK